MCPCGLVSRSLHASMSYCWGLATVCQHSSCQIPPRDSELWEAWRRLVPCPPKCSERVYLFLQVVDEGVSSFPGSCAGSPWEDAHLRLVGLLLGLRPPCRLSAFSRVAPVQPSSVVSLISQRPLAWWHVCVLHARAHTRFCLVHQPVSHCWSPPSALDKHGPILSAMVSAHSNPFSILALIVSPKCYRYPCHFLVQTPVPFNPHWVLSQSALSRAAGQPFPDAFNKASVRCTHYWKVPCIPG